jgi:tetrahydromethanopterin S-methyltransferase subunit H
MFKFEKEQKVFEIDKVKVGGQPGLLPTVMVGSIFYLGDKIVTDRREGRFDKREALRVLEAEKEASLRTGNPRIIDINGESGDTLVRYIDFVAEETEDPFMIDGVGAEARIVASKHVADVGLVERAVYNSISSDTKPEEIEVIAQTGLKSAVLLLFNKRMPTVEGRLDMLRGTTEEGGLLKMTEAAGIDKPLVDTTVLDAPDIGPVAKAVYLVKKDYGLPAGCGAHNAVDKWHQRRILDDVTQLIGNSVAHTFPITMGADFMLYGPIGNAPEMYTACGLADAFVA